MNDFAATQPAINAVIQEATAAFENGTAAPDYLAEFTRRNGLADHEVLVLIHHAFDIISRRLESKPVTVGIDWEDLRLLGCWAENWGKHLGGDCLERVQAIGRKLDAQHPGLPAVTKAGVVRRHREEKAACEEASATEPDGDIADDRDGLIRLLDAPQVRAALACAISDLVDRNAIRALRGAGPETIEAIRKAAFEEDSPGESSV